MKHRFIHSCIAGLLIFPCLTWGYGVPPIEPPQAPPPPENPQSLGALEVPLANTHSVQSGIGYVSGWYCDLPATDTLTVRFNGGNPNAVLYGASRNDTVTVCGDADNGYVMPLNWNDLGDGLHVVEVFAGDELIASAEVWVTTFGLAFLTGAEATVVIQDFPEAGVTTTLEWRQEQQDFEVVDVQKSGE